ncbi:MULTISPECIES: two-component response regulator DpiA [Providencia]|uniref:Transcriptional regulatory protein n=2 Tax=Providencia alcalifaciens TaxID=126385 RepID=A0AAW9VG34_9GAMM|nr:MULTISPECIES: two-component response regulator DpiA [Providencia]EKT66363.1 DNA-binding response regulator in two-component regulatory system with CitA [Providencia alcalifaciens Dmel2]EUD03845.1 transcriptional regulatory protein DpiA [Providencia alcalifaciens RIMD 1656011]EUD08823.1 transcriptional regulatory protein DpiA [Providencia alcalifaciens R90-1475]EUD12053.1 transcriptional regulatory protein DpiA [Providencia alcalifaciens 205/92]MBF0690488.1 two-component response regulator D
MVKIKILIVEDELLLAEMHAEYIKAYPACDKVWLAGNLAEARKMIEYMKPDLILLDNYLPDGKGIDLVHELLQERNSADIVFTTAASDMETVTEAIRLGVFDYLVKPVAYERLGQTLDRYIQRKSVLHGTNKTNQSQIDDMFNTYARGESKEELPTGIDALTLDKVLALFAASDAEYTAETIAETIKLSRTTARRYLEYCLAQHKIEAEIEYGKVGRPQRIYRGKQS